MNWNTDLAACPEGTPVLVTLLQPRHGPGVKYVCEAWVHPDDSSGDLTWSNPEDEHFESLETREDEVIAWCHKPEPFDPDNTAPVSIDQETVSSLPMIQVLNFPESVNTARDALSAIIEDDTKKPYEVEKAAIALLLALNAADAAPVSGSGSLAELVGTLARMTPYGDGPEDLEPNAANGEDAMRVLSHWILKAREIRDGKPAQDNPAPVSPQPRTVREWLETLPPGYRELALKNFGDRPSTKKVDDFREAIWGAFTWGDTSEGHEFWRSVAQHFTEGEEAPLPELPTT